jgi:hypothetical protein
MGLDTWEKRKLATPSEGTLKKQRVERNPKPTAPHSCPKLQPNDKGKGKIRDKPREKIRETGQCEEKVQSQASMDPEQGKDLKNPQETIVPITYKSQADKGSMKTSAEATKTVVSKTTGDKPPTTTRSGPPPTIGPRPIFIYGEGSIPPHSNPPQLKGKGLGQCWKSLC